MQNVEFYYFLFQFCCFFNFYTLKFNFVCVCVCFFFKLFLFICYKGGCFFLWRDNFTGSLRNAISALCIPLKKNETSLYFLCVYNSPLMMNCLGKVVPLGCNL